ncbi:MAG: SAM-dependent methyltransferase [Halieaceae bacterium]|nr:SAM-dependent methyltransferase [Halieaceae bacterium]
MGKKKSSSKFWLREHKLDPYVLAAKKDGYRSRASYKLIDLDRRYGFLCKGVRVLDLGCAPGGWSQVAISKIGPTGRLVASDILPMLPIDGVTFIQGDFSDEIVMQSILQEFSCSQADVVMSDMAPNLSGVNAVDQPRSLYLAELAAEIAANILASGGIFIVKLFHGEGFDSFVRYCKQSFKSVNIRKPDSSRAKSREVYLVAKGFLGANSHT